MAFSKTARGSAQKSSGPLDTPPMLNASDSTRLAVHSNIKLLHSAERRTFSLTAPRTWNALPANIRECNTVAKFKKDLKNILVQ